MSINSSTKRALASHEGVRLAFGPDDQEEFTGPGGRSAPGTPAQRKIPKDHSFDPQSLKPLIKTLWSLSVALGHALTAHRQFSRLKSVGFSPDGLIGGRGYILPVKDVRAKLHEATEAISTVCDTIYDEINAPHWKPKLGELEESDDDMEKLLQDAIGYINDPEGEAEEDMEEVEKRPPSKSRFKTEEDEQKGSKLPNGGSVGNDPQGPNPARTDRPQMTKQADAWRRTANSSVNPDTLPGPRVDHLERGEQTGPGGSYNRDEPVVDDEWGRSQGVGREYDYTSEWDNDLREFAAGKAGESGIPDATTDRTPTEGYDFGLGMGEGNDAHGQGAGGYENPDPSGKGVYGPRAQLPGTTPLKNPGGGGLETVEQSVSDLGLPSVQAQAKLPNDGESPVARSDYFAGPKGNDFDGISRRSEAELPGDDTPEGTSDADRDLMNKSEVSEPISEPYVRYDYSTPEMRPDYTYQRDPVQGPYVKQ